MPIESISTLAIALVTSDRKARLHNLEMMIEDAFGLSWGSASTALLPARGRK
jgi:hypothetical protein